MGSIRQQIMILMLQSGILEVTLHACPTAFGRLLPVATSRYGAFLRLLRCFSSGVIASEYPRFENQISLSRSCPNRFQINRAVRR